MGAVLHTLNIRLFPDQLTYIVNHAADKVVVVDGSLCPLLAQLLPAPQTVRPRRGLRHGRPSPLEGCRPQVHDHADLLEGRPTAFDWPELDEHSAAAMCYTSGTTGNPKGVVYSHRSICLHSHAGGDGRVVRLHRSATVLLAVVPQFHVNAWGLPYAAFMVGVNIVMPDRFLQPEPRSPR